MKGFCCLACQGETEVVIDFKSGGTSCSACGLLLPSVAHQVPGNETIPQATNLSTSVSKLNCTTGNSFTSPKSLSRRPPQQRKRFMCSLMTVIEISDRLGLKPAIKQRAQEIYKELKYKIKKEKCRGWFQSRTCKLKSEAIPAACVLIAARDMKQPHRFEEISAAASEIPKKMISKAFKVITTFLGDIEMRPSLLSDAEEFAKRFCTRLKMQDDAKMAVQEAVQNSRDIDVRRQDASVAAAIIYIITQVSSSDDCRTITIQDIYEATEISVSTLRRTLNDLLPYVSGLIPKWYAIVDVERIRNVMRICFLEAKKKQLRQR